MRTLDEVIEIASDWTNEFDEMSIEKQMLHYLKEYQRYQNTPSRNGHMALVDYFEESQKNEPLTWDELRRMEGKPVWLETQSKGGRFAIFERIGSVYEPDDVAIFSCHSGITCYGYNLGKTWQVYRKEHS